MITKLFILVLMTYFHIIDDFHLQGILARMKQKRWWEQQDGYTPAYRYDYIVCLIVHAFQWSFTMMIPLGVYCYIINDLNANLFVVFVVNIILHAIVDHLKANLLVINLVHDQVLHMLQIMTTWSVILFSEWRIL